MPLIPAFGRLRQEDSLSSRLAWYKIQGQPGLFHREILSQKEKKKEITCSCSNLDAALKYSLSTSLLICTTGKLGNLACFCFVLLDKVSLAHRLTSDLLFSRGWP